MGEKKARGLAAAWKKESAKLPQSVRHLMLSRVRIDGVKARPDSWFKPTAWPLHHSLQAVQMSALAAAHHRCQPYRAAPATRAPHAVCSPLPTASTADGCLRFDPTGASRSGREVVLASAEAPVSHGGLEPPAI